MTAWNGGRETLLHVRCAAPALAGRAVLLGGLAAGYVVATYHLSDARSDLIVVVSVFAGALVAGMVGFAFSAIAAAILSHWIAPIEFVPLLLACSIATQLFSIARLWRSMQWRRCAPFLTGGLAGIPLGAALLRDSDPRLFAACFGAFLVAYGIFMLLKPGLVIRRGNGLADAACGMLGGITGGAVAFPGAFPTVWCSLRALPKEVQRGVVQPFILAMQIATLLYFSGLGMFTSDTMASFIACVPAVLLGTWIGLALFEGIDDAAFRRVVLIFLIVSGAGLLF